MQLVATAQYRWSADGEYKVEMMQSCNAMQCNEINLGVYRPFQEKGERLTRELAHACLVLAIVLADHDSQAQYSCGGLLVVLFLMLRLA